MGNMCESVVEIKKKSRLCERKLKKFFLMVKLP